MKTLIKERRLLDYCTGPEFEYRPSWSQDGQMVSLLFYRDCRLRFGCLSAEDLLGERLDRAVVLFEDGSRVGPSSWHPVTHRVCAGIADGHGGWVIEEFGTGREIGQKRRLARQSISAEPTHSPDGQWLAFSANRPRRLLRRRHTIRLLEPGCAKEHRLCDCWWRSTWQPKWSPDGHRIAFVREYPRGASRVKILDVTTGRQRCAKTTGIGLRLVRQEGPTWGDDGRYLAFMEYDITKDLADWDGCSVVVLDTKMGEWVDLKQTENGIFIRGDLAWRPRSNVLLCRVDDGLAALELGIS